MSDAEDLTEKQGEASPWWQRVRDVLSASESVGAAFTAALVCRAVANELYSELKVSV